MMVLAMVMVMVVKLGGGVVLGWMARLMRTRL